MVARAVRRVAQDIWRVEKRIDSSGLRVGKVAFIIASMASVTPGVKVVMTTVYRIQNFFISCLKVN